MDCNDENLCDPCHEQAHLDDVLAELKERRPVAFLILYLFEDSQEAPGLFHARRKWAVQSEQERVVLALEGARAIQELLEEELRDGFQ